MNWPVTIVILLLIIITVLAALVVIRFIRRYYTSKLYILVVGLFFQIVVPVGILPIVNNSSKEIWIQHLSMQIAVVGDVLGMFMILFGLSYHKSEQIELRYLFLSAILSSIMTISIYRMNPVNHNIVYTPLEYIFNALAYIWVSIELFLVMTENLSKDKIIQEYMVVVYPLVTMFQAFIFIYSALMESTYFSTIAFLGVTLLGNLSLSYILIWKPELLLSVNNSQLSRLIILDKETGVALLRYENKRVEKMSSQLAGMAVVGVLQVIQEISGKEEMLEMLGYDDYKIFTSTGDRYIALMFCIGGHDILDRLLDNFLEMFERNITLDRNIIPEETVQEFEELVEKRLHILL